MDRRIVIPTVLLVLALGVFIAAGLCLPAAQPDLAAAGTPQVPQPSACPLPQLAGTVGGLPMSGDFDDRRLAVTETLQPLRPS
jgi:hypothetical protein